MEFDVEWVKCLISCVEERFGFGMMRVPEVGVTAGSLMGLGLGLGDVDVFYDGSDISTTGLGVLSSQDVRSTTDGLVVV